MSGFYTKNQGFIGLVGINRPDNFQLIGGLAGGFLYNFTSFTFTNANTTGRLGVTKQSLISSYNTTDNPWLNDNDFYDMPEFRGYQLWTVPINGTYRFIVTGASRGSSSSEGAAAKITADVVLQAGQKLWIVCGQQATGNNEVGSGGSWVVLSNNGQIAGSTPLLVAGGAGDYSFYGSEGAFQTGQQFSNAQTTNNLDASVLNVSGVTSPTTGNGGTIFRNTTTTGFVTGGGGFNTDGEFFTGGNTQGQGLSFFNGLFGGLYQNNTFDTTTINGGGFGGGGARSGGFGTGGGGGYTGGASAGGNNPNLRRSTGGSSFVTETATNVTRELASASAPSASAQQGSVQVEFLG